MKSKMKHTKFDDIPYIAIEGDDLLREYDEKYESEIQKFLEEVDEYYEMRAKEYKSRVRKEFEKTYKCPYCDEELSK